jgi:hypothetical protein
MPILYFGPGFPCGPPIFLFFSQQIKSSFGPFGLVAQQARRPFFHLGTEAMQPTPPPFSACCWPAHRDYGHLRHMGNRMPLRAPSPSLSETVIPSSSRTATASIEAPLAGRRPDASPSVCLAAPSYKKHPQPLRFPPLSNPLPISLFPVHGPLLDEACRPPPVKAIARPPLLRRYPMPPPVSTILTPSTSQWPRDDNLWSETPRSRATARPWCTVTTSPWWTEATRSPRATDPVHGNFQTKTILNSWKSLATFQKTP